MRDWTLIALIAGLVCLAVAAFLVLRTAALLLEFGLPLTYASLGPIALSLMVAGSTLCLAAVVGIVRRRRNP